MLGDLCNGNSMGVVLSSTEGTGITVSATANTKGSWVQLTASCPSDICRLFVFADFFTNYAYTETNAVDIGVGASGSEVVIASNLVFGAGTQYQHWTFVVELPVSIPAGTRISARAQIDTASRTADSPNVILVGYDGGFTQSEGGAGVDAIGFNAGTTAGTAVTGGTNAKGSYAQLTASTTRDYIGLFGLLDVQGVASPSNNQMLMDVAVGASGSEKVIIPDSLLTKWVSGNGYIPFVPIKIPAGTRLSARSSNGAVVANLTLYGVYE